jgi:hypothetical protein
MREDALPRRRRESLSGGRPGQMHIQDQSGRIPKCQYNFDIGEFDGIPNSIAQ